MLDSPAYSGAFRADILAGGQMALKPTDEDFDVIVIGGGPAGSAAAYTARQNGLSVAVIDKKTFPRDKLCGALFSSRSRDYYTEIFGRQLDPALFGPKNEIEFWLGGRKIGYMDDVPTLYVTMRWDLDHLCLGHAFEAGAVDMTGQAVAEIDEVGNAVAMKDGRRLGYKVLIGADGVNSMVARTLYGRAFDHERIGFALEIELDGDHLKPDEPVRIDFAAAKWGYGWEFPKPGTTTIGVGGIHSENPDMKAKMGDYLELLGIDRDVKRYKGHFLPFGDVRKKPGRGNIILAGDAAGLVDPITGEGIAFALRSGQFAAEAAAESLKPGISGSALAIYKRKLKEIHRSLNIARLIRPILSRPSGERAFEYMFTHSVTLKRQYMQLLGGELEYPTILKRVIRKLPQYLLVSIKRRSGAA